MTPVGVEHRGGGGVEGGGGVAHGKTLVVQGGVLTGGVSIHDLLGQSRHVVATVRLGGVVTAVRKHTQKGRQVGTVSTKKKAIKSKL